MDTQEGQPRRVSSAELKSIMMSDPEGTNRAFGWVMDDIVNVFFSANPEHPQKERITGLVNSEKTLTSDEMSEVLKFAIGSEVISQDEYTDRMKSTYAKQNNLEVLVN